MEKIIREFSAGCIVVKKDKKTNKNLFLLGKHSGYHKWALPKGMIEVKETGWQAALRETFEETGIKAKIINKKPIFKIQYFFYASLKTERQKKFSTRRIKKYPEQLKNDKTTKKTKIFKTVNFYLAEYLSGDPKNHGWEMEDAGWFNLIKALKLMAFKQEKQALKTAKQKLKEIKQR